MCVCLHIYSFGLVALRDSGIIAKHQYMHTLATTKASAEIGWSDYSQYHDTS